jgi:hypothetical protein
MDMKINPKFKFGDQVVLKTDQTTLRQVSGMMIRPLPNRGVFITYGIARGNEETWHNDCELMHITSNFKVKGFKG